MIFTFFGAIFLFFCILSSFLKLEKQFYVFIFSIPFNATVLFEIKTSENYLSVSPSLFLAIIILTRILTLKKIGFSKNSVIFPMLFLISILASGLYNIVFPIEIEKFNGLKQEFENITSNPNLTSLTQFFYLAFWIMFVFFINRNIFVDMNRVVVSSLYAASFVGTWGIYQFLAGYYSFQYPYWIFNNSQSSYLTGYLQRIGESNLPRVTSVSAEPSILSAYLLVSIIIAIMANIKHSKISTIVQYYCITSSILSLLLSTSTTAYIGLVAVIFTISIYYIFISKTLFNKIIYIFIFLSSLIMVGYTYPAIEKYISGFTTDKAQSFSFVNRAKTIASAYKNYQDSPIFGVGIGSVTSYSIVLWLLASFGIIGSFTFIFYLGSFIFKKNQQLFITSAIIIIVIVDVISGFSYNYAVFWLPFVLSSIFDARRLVKKGG